MIRASQITDLDLDSGAAAGQTAAVDLRQLRTFEAVARTGSFTAAAAELAYTQSAVSQHVAALEAALGQALLTRRPVALTPAGARLAVHARHLLLRLDVARTELTAHTDEPVELTVAVTPTGFTGRIAELLARARSGRPGSAGPGGTGPVVIRLQQVPPDEALRRLAAGAAEAAVLDGVTTANQPIAAAEPGVLARHLVAEQPLRVLLPAGHPLAGSAGLDLASLRDAHWVDAPLLRCDPGAVPGHPPVPATGRLRYDGDDAAGLVRLVAHQLGLALLPEGLLVGHPGVAAVPLRSPAVVHRVELVHLPGRAEAVRPLLAALHG